MHLGPLSGITISVFVMENLYFFHSHSVFQQEGTVKPYANFNADQDAEVLRKAMKGLGKLSFVKRLLYIVCSKQIWGKCLFSQKKLERFGFEFLFIRSEHNLR